MQALCNPTKYRQRLRSWGQKKVTLLYLLPVITASFILNIPQAVSVTNKGLLFESNKLYMDFLFYFQLFHPLLTSVSMSAFCLVWMNSKIFLRIKARRVRGVNRTVTRHMEAVQVKTETYFIPMLIQSPQGRISVLSVAISSVLNIPRAVLCVLEVARISSVLDCQVISQHNF